MQDSMGHCHCDRLETGHGLLSVEEARQLALDLLRPIQAQELVDLGEAIGRIAARDLNAPRAMPFFDNSAMDGYAICTREMKDEGPFNLAVIGESAAGGSEAQLAGLSPSGENAVRIYTGAPVPKGFDAVIAQEYCRVELDRIRFDTRPETGCNIRFKGSDMERGACLVQSGTKIAAHHIGLLAANGYSAINVKMKPRIGVLSTGDELVQPGEQTAPGQIYDCNKPMLMGLLAEMGVEAVDLGVLPDDPDATHALLVRCRNAFDLIISTGSVSVGDRDYLKPAFKAAGGSIASWKVAVKPGKPVMFGTLGKTIFTGLPGNPFAVFVGFHLFAKAQIMRLCGQINSPVKWQTARAEFSWYRKPGRMEIFPVRRVLVQGSNSQALERLGNSVSAALYPLANADGLAMVSPDCEAVNPGAPIQWQPFCW